VLAKGTLEEVPLETWRLYALPPQYPPRSVKEVRARTLLGALECLRSGMTTIQDMLTLYPFEDRHLDAVMRAYDEIGIRVVFSLQYADRKGLETIPYWKDIFPQDLHPLLSTAAEPERQLDLLGHFEATCLAAPPRPRVHWALGPSAPERCSSALMTRTMELARRYDVPVYSHIYESRGMALQARLTLPEHGGSLIKRLAAEGALDPLLNLAHSVWLARDEIDLLAATGTGVVLNPQGNLKMKCGIPPIRALQDAGVRVALGCDNCSCSDAQNMFMAMKLFALLAAASDPVPGPPQAAAAIGAATAAGAQSARLGHVIGQIAPGYKADLTLIDMRDPSWSPLNSAARQLVHVEAGRGRASRCRRRRRGRARPAPDHDRRERHLRRRRNGDARLPSRLRRHLGAGEAPAALARSGASANRFDRDGPRADVHPVLNNDARTRVLSADPPYSFPIGRGLRASSRVASRACSTRNAASSLSPRPPPAEVAAGNSSPPPLR
jgi:5-methylthioadenosine/S-adenosylhomocysteine deaminase